MHPPCCSCSRCSTSASGPPPRPWSAQPSVLRARRRPRESHRAEREKEREGGTERERAREKGRGREAVQIAGMAMVERYRSNEPLCLLQEGHRKEHWKKRAEDVAWWWADARRGNTGRAGWGGLGINDAGVVAPERRRRAASGEREHRAPRARQPHGTGVPRSYETFPSQDPTVGVCPGPCGGPGGGGCFL